MGGSASPSRVAGAIRERGISSVPLKPQDVQQLMDTLVADGRLDYAGAAKRRAMLYARAAAAVYRPDGGYAGASKGAGASSSRGDDDNDRGFEEGACRRLGAGLHRELGSDRLHYRKRFTVIDSDEACLISPLSAPHRRRRRRRR